MQVNVCEPGHPVLGGTPSDWPELLGYNKLIAKPGATVVVWADEDPMLVVGEYGQGRTAAFASDLAPHWAPREFLDWPHYAGLWTAILSWTAQNQTPGTLS